MSRTSARTRRFVIESSRHSSLPAATVMRLITEPDTWPDWQPEIVSTEGPRVRELSEVVFGRARMLGFEVEGQSTILNSDGTSFIEDVIVGVRMQVHYRVEEQAEGCLVTRVLEAELPGGLSGRILGFFLRFRLRTMQKEVLDALAGQADVSD